VETIEIARRPEDVFAYVTDPDHLRDWQASVVDVKRQDTGSLHVGTKVMVTRRIGRRTQPMTVQFAELDPPRSWSVRGVDGPIRGNVDATVEPVGEGDRSRVTLSIDFESHGIG
jgi:carbon monoxide dehydrogenase subunit G